jgi:N6-L-threonylcarbamoyladenine synthase
MASSWDAGCAPTRRIMTIVLGIESSCDETAAALVTDGRVILAQHIASQDEAHRPYGGVVPEIAARAHVEKLAPLIAATLADAGMTLDQVDAVAATAGPGLIGGVMVGLVTGKALAMASDKPLLAINHLEGHALSPRLADPTLEYPYLLLLVSGGHCQILLVEGVGRYRRLATTIDDALGEAFDKTAKLLGLGYPGGPAVERLAREGDPKAVPLPRPLMGSKEPHFSFAGLKSAVMRAVQAGGEGSAGTSTAPDQIRGRAGLGAYGQFRKTSAQPELVEGRTPTSAPYSKADIAASFQQAAIDCVIDRTARAIAVAGPVTALVAAGGVAANTAIRLALEQLAAAYGLRFVAPPLALCTDNAAMIAWAGIERLALGQSDPLDIAARPRWPLDADAPPVRGAGVKA